MKSIDFRNATFEHLRAQLVKKREAVWLDWIAYEVRHGAAGATTRAVSDWAKRDILAFRPRCTELYQLGVLALVEPSAERETRNAESETPRSALPVPRSHEGRYRLRSLDQWQAWHAEQQCAAISGQLQMAI